MTLFVDYLISVAVVAEQREKDIKYRVVVR